MKIKVLIMSINIILVSGCALWALDKEEAQKKLFQVNSIVLYERFNDARPPRTIEEQVKIIKDVNADFILRAWFSSNTLVNTCSEDPDPEQCNQRCQSYEHLENTSREIRRALPGTIICGAISMRIEQSVFDPVIRKWFYYPDTWKMALDPKKWGIKNITKETFQWRYAKSHDWYDGSRKNYEPSKMIHYLPDLTNAQYQQLFLNTAKRSIDAGANAFWVDLFWVQARQMAKLTSSESHPAVIDNLKSMNKLIQLIHDYGISKGKYIYVGTWFSTHTPASFKPYIQGLDFITITPEPEEILSLKLNEAVWDSYIKEAEQVFPNVPIFALIDWGWGNKLSPMKAFSQKLTPEQQREFLKIADNFFERKGIKFVYPVHGGAMGKEPFRQSFGQYKNYDALAPEFDTFGTIKELANKKASEPLPTPTLVIQPVFNKNWLYEGPVYETHPYYYDGTFKGMIKKIPEIADLGAKTTYLMPVWENSGGDYRILDYYKIDPKYGSEKELRELVDTVHKYGMKIVFDLTTRVAAPGSIPWNENLTMRMSLSDLKSKAKELGWKLKYKTDNKGRKIVYYDTRYKASNKINAKNTRTKRISQVGGRIVSDEVVLNTFPVASKGIAIDRTNSGTIDYFTKAAEYYVENFDIDGWRIDNPLDNWNPQIIPGDHSIVPLLRSVKDAVNKAKPDAVMLAENAWISSRKHVPLDEMCEASYSYEFNDYVYSDIIAGKSTSQQLIEFLNKEKISYNRYRTRFLETHDKTRINKVVPELHKPLAVLISTIPGIPMIQAGQEIRTNEPFPKPIDWAHGDSDLRGFYKKVFKIRRMYSALKYGLISGVWKSGDNIMAYLRSYENETVIVTINFSNKQSESVLSVPFPQGTRLTDELSGEIFMVEDPSGFSIAVPGYGARILTRVRN